MRFSSSPVPPPRRLGRFRRRDGGGRTTGRIVVMARWPAPGRCKRRLAAGCGTAPAAAIQARLTSHTLRVAAAAAAASGAELCLAVDGLGAGALQRWQRGLLRHGGLASGSDVQLRVQGGGSLGCRMQRQLRLGFAGGAGRVVLIGTDLPGLECGDLSLALALLQTDPLVLGPAADGGYWLIGLNRAGFQKAGALLMSGIGWGGGEVLGDTLARAAQRQLPARLLRLQRDVDERADLLAWLGTAHSPARNGLASAWR